METSKLKSARIGDLLWVVVLLSFAIVIAYPRWRAGIDWRDEGLLAYGAVRVINGEIPHRDFVSLQPPLSYYTSAVVFKIFGISLLSLRVFGLSIFLILPLLIYGVGHNLMGQILSFAAAVPACILGLPYFGFVPFAVWQGIACSFAATFLFFPALLTKRQWLAFPAGWLTGISLFLRHDQAVYTVIAIFVLVIALNFARDGAVPRSNLRRALLLWLAGIAIVFIPLTIIWWKIGALPEMFRQLVVFPFATYRKTSSLPFPKFILHKSLADTAVIFLFYIPLFVQAVAAIYLVQSIVRRRFYLPEAVLLFLLVWSALFYFQVSVRSDQTHLLITLPPLFLLAAFGWSLVSETFSNSRKIGLIFSSVLAIAVASFLWIVHPVTLPDVSQANEQLMLNRGGVRIQQAHIVRDFIQQLQANVPPTKSILALPYQPMFYFLCERRNPTRWNYLWPGDQTTYDYENLIAQAERDPPAVVLLSERSAVATFAPTIIEYVEARYAYTGNVGDIAIYVRRDSH